MKIKGTFSRREVTHPVLAEAVTQFQSLAYKELLLADGPVRTQIMGAPSTAKEQQSERVREFMNYQLMSEMKEYEAEFDQMLFYLPLSGSTFKKVYYDELLGRAVSKFVPADDLLVPYSATSLGRRAIIHKINISERFRKQQVSGFYRDIEVSEASNEDDTIRKRTRVRRNCKSENLRHVYFVECHVDLDLEVLKIPIPIQEKQPESNFLTLSRLKKEVVKFYLFVETTKQLI